MKRTLIVLVTLILAMMSASPASADAGWTWPIDGHEVDREFDLPDSKYGAGNRGVDLRGRVGDEVRSVAAGQVSFVGEIAHVQIVVVSHGAERSTYQPVDASVRVGESVAAGQPIGILVGRGSHCLDGACLHLGRKRGDTYLDPLELIASAGQFRLIDPDGAVPQPPPLGIREFSRPVSGPITSPFGTRIHPITGERKLHDGTDFGVPCGTPVKAAAAGKVVSSGDRGAYGETVAVEHSPGVVTSYSHLSAESVSVGDQVSAGEVVGMSGNTGLSTGCHLHFMLRKDGKPVNPMG